MLSTNLLDQYVVSGWGDQQQYHKIVAVVAQPRGLEIWARNCDGILISYDADGCNTTLCPPVAKQIYELGQKLQIATLEEDRVPIREEINRLTDEMKACVAQ